MERVSGLPANTVYSANRIVASSPRVPSGVSPLPLSAPRSASTTDTAPRTSLPTCCRRSVTTLVPTPSGSSPSSPTRHTRRARTFTSTGPEGVETSLPRYVPMCRVKVQKLTCSADIQCLSVQISTACIAKAQHCPDLHLKKNKCAEQDSLNLE